ncbi:FkbM family methyltransferase [Spirosoma radiotolerans]|uniref:FkbM family methyltransferase n=1 Tax=Spirosoma radiotolerans TaxID=1379870 RepID=UPI00130D86F7|nr:FkbM family methyltransferase [Spirosoma radiotolerans]
MGKIIQLVKQLMGVHPQQGIKPLSRLIYLGSLYNGYHIPDSFITKESVCYCVGAGADISFDAELKMKYDARIFIFDPTPEGIDHFALVKEYAEKGYLLTIHNVAPYSKGAYTYQLTPEEVQEMTFVEVGVWDQKTTLKFFAPQKDNYISRSVYLFKESGDYLEAPVDRLSNLMKTLGHSAIDLLKLEIEGAEYTVIDTIIEDKLDIKVILVEFDEVHNATDKRFHFRIKKACDKLKNAGYVLVHSTESMKRTFVREDVYEQLQAAYK